jgi:hypothetical protein
MSTTVKQDLSPVECKEHLDDMLEMELEVHELEQKMNKAHENYKEHKGRYEIKRDEMLQTLRGLNEEHPLFDEKNTVDVPWPFPVPEDTAQATLANVAADPVVLGLSVSVVKTVRDKIGCSTLGQLQEYLKAGSKLSADEQTKRKVKLGKDIGANGAMKVLRAVASFLGNRTKGKKGKATEKPTQAPPTAEPMLTLHWKDTKVADLQDITPMQSQLMGQLEMSTVGKALDRFAVLLKGMPAGGPPDFLKKQLAAFMALTPSVAGKIIDAIYAFEEEHASREAKQS